MTIAHPGLLAAFAAGLLSFLSPCVFPLVPGYLSYLAGTTLHEVQGKGTVHTSIGIHALCFVLGFACIFVLFGATASSIGALLVAYRLLIAQVAGVLLILFGIVLTGLLPIPLLSAEHRLHVAGSQPSLLRSTLVGVTFGAGWSPCMGPVLASILALAAVGATVVQGVIFLLVYALGLGIPFLLIGLFIDRARPMVGRINRYTGPLSIIGGFLLILTGMLILSGRLAELATLGPLFNV